MLRLLFAAMAVAAQNLPSWATTEDNTYSIRGQLMDLLRDSPTLDDEFMNKVLISPRQGVSHLLYDEVMKLVREIKASFPKIIKLESIGKSFQGRDIWMLKLEAHRFLERNGLAVNT